MSGFGSAGRLFFTAACGKIRVPSVHGRRDAQFAASSTVLPSCSEISPLLCSFRYVLSFSKFDFRQNRGYNESIVICRSLSVTPVNERMKSFKVEESLGIPPPPPKPITPYLRWSLETRAKLVKDSPEKSFLG